MKRPLAPKLEEHAREQVQRRAAQIEHILENCSDLDLEDYQALQYLRFELESYVDIVFRLSGEQLVIPKEFQFRDTSTIFPAMGYDPRKTFYDD